MLEIDIKPNILDRKRKLIISLDLISYEDSNWKDIPDTTFKKGEIAGFRFGIEPIQGYAFTIGRRYCVDILGEDNRIIKISFTSLYKIRQQQLYKNYVAIIDAFLHTHQDNILNRYVESFNQDSSVEILGTTFGQDSIKFNGHNIPYEDLGCKEYTGYYALFSKSNPKIYKTYSYLNDWNSAAVYSISKRLLAKNGL
jgi:hypothetical protein